MFSRDNSIIRLSIFEKKGKLKKSLVKIQGCQDLKLAFLEMIWPHCARAAHSNNDLVKMHWQNDNMQDRAAKIL